MVARSSQSRASGDLRFMHRALSLARQGRTHPNPYVGAVVVQGQHIVGEGFHPQKGQPHAEVFALAAAGEAAHGATLYVSLEPCSHTDGGRVPCVARCLQARIARVVAAMEDPDTRVSGRGFEQLRAAGVSVTVGVAERQARLLNEAYIKHRATGLPFILHKVAMTLDGKIAAPNGSSRWITGPEARRAVHRLRDRADAVLVGVGTILADDPSLTTRLPTGNGHNPLRVIMDSNLQTPATAQVARTGTLILTTEEGAEKNSAARHTLEGLGVEIVALPADKTGRVASLSVAELLAQRGLLSVLLESGGVLASAFWRVGLVDKVWYFVAPKIMGGSGAQTPVAGGLADSLEGATRLGRLHVRRYGRDIVIEARVRRTNI